jgi:hypothetical protein
MSALAFLVHHRSVDLVGVTAMHALQSEMNYAKIVVALRRDDAYILEGSGVEADQSWIDACLAQAHWINPNKHRHAFYAANAGAIAAAETGAAWPRPWLGKMLSTDRPDLVGGSHSALASWLSAEAPEHDGEFSVTLASWDHESGIAALPHGNWPSGEARLLRAQLWTTVLRAEDLEQAETLVRGLALSESREKGLLIHPHMEGWATVGASAKAQGLSAGA